MDCTALDLRIGIVACSLPTEPTVLAASKPLDMMYSGALVDWRLQEDVSACTKRKHATMPVGKLRAQEYRNPVKDLGRLSWLWTPCSTPAFRLLCVCLTSSNSPMTSWTVPARSVWSSMNDSKCSSLAVLVAPAFVPTCCFAYGPSPHPLQCGRTMTVTPPMNAKLLRAQGQKDIQPDESPVL